MIRTPELIIAHLHVHHRKQFLRLRLLAERLVVRGRRSISSASSSSVAGRPVRSAIAGQELGVNRRLVQQGVEVRELWSSSSASSCVGTISEDEFGKGSRRRRCRRKREKRLRVALFRRVRKIRTASQLSRSRARAGSWHGEGDLAAVPREGAARRPSAGGARDRGSGACEMVGRAGSRARTRGTGRARRRSVPKLGTARA